MRAGHWRRASSTCASACAPDVLPGLIAISRRALASEASRSPTARSARASRYSGHPSVGLALVISFSNSRARFAPELSGMLNRANAHRVFSAESRGLCSAACSYARAASGQRSPFSYAEASDS